MVVSVCFKGTDCSGRIDDKVLHCVDVDEYPDEVAIYLEAFEHSFPNPSAICKVACFQFCERKGVRVEP